MITIRPVSDLRNKFSEVQEICETSDEPIFFTKNGNALLVAMGHHAYEKLVARLDLMQKLLVAEKQSVQGKYAGNSREVFEKLRAKLSEHGNSVS